MYTVPLPYLWKELLSKKMALRNVTTVALCLAWTDIFVLNAAFKSCNVSMMVAAKIWKGGISTIIPYNVHTDW